MIKLKNIYILLSIIILIHIIAVFRSWYFSIPWLDIPMHFMGGFWTALLIIWIKNIAPGIFGKSNFIGDFIIVLGFTAFIGVLWEFFEFSVDLFIIIKNGLPDLWISQQGLTDTMGDLLFDLLGGLLAFFIGQKEKYLKHFSKI